MNYGTACQRLAPRYVMSMHPVPVLHADRMKLTAKVLIISHPQVEEEQSGPHDAIPSVAQD
jgi:hypothetical protein